MRRTLAIAALAALGALSALCGGVYFGMMAMPGRSYEPDEAGAAPPQPEIVARLRADLEVLAVQIGERNTRRPAALARSADFLERRLTEAGHAPRRESFEAGGTRCDNLIVDIPGASGAWFVVGAHYDSARGSPGANDNGTGVVALLELARRFASTSHHHGLRMVLFTNEEPPFFKTAKMGSQVHVKRTAERGDAIVGMLSLETMGRFDDAPGSQRYPKPLSAFYPERGDFIAFVGDYGSRAPVRHTIGLFRHEARVPSEGAALPRTVPGVDWSDHASFWALGVPALMITDTAPFRSEHYHTENDTLEEVDFDRLAETVRALEPVIARLLSGR